MSEVAIAIRMCSSYGWLNYGQKIDASSAGF